MFMTKQALPQPIRRWLYDALPSWQREGLLGPEQAVGILDLYEDEEQLRDNRGNFVSFVLYGLGAFLFGLAVLLVVGFNWQSISREAKLVTVLAVIAATHTAALWVRRRSPAVSEVIFFFGCLLYGAGIWLIGQAFHLDAHYPDGVFWWAVGVLPFALVLDSLLIHFLLVALLAQWVHMEMVGFMHLRPWWAMNLLPNGAWALPVFAAPGLLWAYRRPSPTAVGLYVALFAWWVVLQAFVWRFGMSPLSIFWVCGIGALLMLAAEAHRPGNSLAIPYRLWGALLSAGSLILMSSWRFWEMVQRSRQWGGLNFDYTTQLIIPGVAFGLLTLAGVGLCYLTSSRRGLVPTVLLGLTIALAMWTMLVPNDWTVAVVTVVVANCAMIGLAIYLIHVGAQEERLRPFGAGVLYFLIWAIARYVDLFSSVGGMLGTAVIFTLCGVALVVVGRFWTRLKRHEPILPTTAATTWSGPVWASAALMWFRERGRSVLAVAVAFHLLFLVGMIAVESAPLWFGKTIMLRVRPIDPRDFFRGDYVILNYDINQMMPSAPEEAGQPTYVVIEPDADGKHWRGVSASYTRPTTGVYLIGRSDFRGWRRLSFGIEAYFVQEGEGLKWEEAARNGQLTAEVAIAPWGKAKLKRLIIGP
jgi:uncharacterized membrane protein/uncharacterized membrane-anchored protein